MRILIVEDEPKTAAYVRKGLIEHGYVVDVASDGLGGLHLATTTEYDLILLDVMLPGIDGWSVLQGVRRQRQTPVLFLSARDQVDDRVKGLKLGADDYLVKPFAFSELLARVQNILRRGQAPRDRTLRIADLEIDPERRRVAGVARRRSSGAHVPAVPRPRARVDRSPCRMGRTGTSGSATQDHHCSESSTPSSLLCSWAESRGVLERVKGIEPLTKIVSDRLRPGGL